MIRWWYFHREDDELVLATDSDFPDRPIDAQDDNGNAHTPWYNNTEHFDEHHVHVRAAKWDTAYRKALKMIGKGY